MSDLIYLASPYSAPEFGTREARYHLACRAAAKLMMNGAVVFSPIAHSHPIEAWFPEIKDGEWWLRQDVAILRHCARLVVLRLDGWERSKGVAREVELAHELGIPVDFLDP